MKVQCSNCEGRRQFCGGYFSDGSEYWFNCPTCDGKGYVIVAASTATPKEDSPLLETEGREMKGAQVGQVNVERSLRYVREGVGGGLAKPSPLRARVARSGLRT